MTHSSTSAAVSMRNKFYSGFKFFSILLLVLLVSGKMVGQVAILELGTASQSANTTGAATFTTKDANINALPTLSLTVGQQGQAGGAGYVGSKTWNNASLTTSTYWQFTVTAATGYQLSVTALSLRMYRSATGPGSIALATDADGYVSTIGGTQTLAATTNSTISFTGLTLNNKTSITFRVYAYGASAATGTLRIGDGAATSPDISLTGTLSSATSTDATLSSMSISAGTLSPTFASGTIAYSATVPYSTSSITVTPTRNQANATIQARVNGGTYASVTSGSASASLSLNPGTTNTIDVLVTAQDGTTTKTYSTTVTRTAAATVSTLSGLVLSDGTLSPTFSSGTTSYTASVPYTTSSITVTPTKTNSFASIQVQVNGGGYSSVTSGSASGSLALTAGTTNTIDVKVTAEDGTFTTYTTTVTRAAVATDATLSALTTTAGALSPTFDSGTTSYTASVSNGTASVTVTPTKTNAFATIQAKVNSGSYASVTSGNASGALSLNEGDNTITVKVTAQDGTTIISYIITVNRAAASVPTISSVGTLSAVSTTYGTASVSPTSFTVSGSAMAAGITVTAPAGFEVSTTSDFSANVGDNASPIVIGSAGTISNTLIYVRLKATASYAGSPYSGNITLTSTGGANQVDVATASSTVTRVQLTITGLSGVGKTYDGTTSASFVGTAVYSGLVNGDTYSVSGTPVASYATATAGNPKTITISGYLAPSSNYLVTDPNVTADISTKAITQSGLSVPASKSYDGTTTAVVSGTAVLQAAEAPGVGSTDDGKPYTGDAISIQGTAVGTYNDANVASASSVTFNGLSVTGAQVGNYRFSTQSPQAATITKAGQSITGVSASATKYVGDANYTFPALSATSGINALSYTSSNPSVASIDASTGFVQVKVAGTTTITVSQAASANYFAANDATQTLTVEAIPSYTLCTSASDLVAGAKYIIVSSATNGTASAMGYQSTNNRPIATTTVTIASGVISTNVATATADLVKPYELTLGGSTGAWTFYDAVYAGYIYAGSSSSNYLKSSASVANWTVTFSTNAAIMTCTTGGYSRNVLQFNSPSALYSCYSSGQSSIYLYKKNSPTVTTTGTLSAVNTTYGTASTSPTSFTVSGSYLVNDILLTAPTGFEISKTVGGASGYASTQTLPQTTGTVSSTTIYARLAATTVYGSYSGNISCVSSPATTVNVATVSSTVSAKGLTIDGLTGSNKSYDGTNTALFTGTPSYNGLVNSESFEVTGTPSASFADASVGNGKAITVTGYTAPNTNYSVTQPSGLTANITANAVSVSANTNSSDLTNLAGADLTITDAELTIDANAATNTTIHAITLSPRAKLTLSDTKTLTVLGNLTLQSSASGSATLVDNNASGGLTVNGTKTMEQYLGVVRNWYVSSPLTNALAPSGYSYFKYDEPGNNPHSSFVTNESEYWEALSPGDFFVQGAGYVAAPSAAPATLSLTTTDGSFITGNKELVLTRTTGKTKEGFNLIGNPYPSYVNARTAINAQSTKLESTVWYRTKAASTYYFETVNTSSGLGTNISGNGAVTGFIPPMQSFWVRVLANQSPSTLTFTNAMRSHEAGTNRLKAPALIDENQVLRLQVSNGLTNDETILYANKSASNGLDTFDSQKMTNGSLTIPEIYSIVNSEHLVINGLNSIPYDTELSLGFTTGQSSTFTIKASEIANFTAGTQIILRDYLDANNVVEQDLTSGSYTFTSAAITTENRFRLVFKAPSIATGLKLPGEGNAWITTNTNGQITINGNVSAGTSVCIFNAIGQCLVSKSLTTTVNVLNTRLVPGIYTVAVTNAGRTATTKVLVK